MSRELSEFHKRKNSKDGHRNDCKYCRSKDRKEKKTYYDEYYNNYYLINSNKIKERTRNYYENNKEVRSKYLENNKDMINKYNRLYHIEHKEIRNKQSCEYYSNNKEHLKNCKYIWVKNNPDKIKKYRYDYRCNNPHIVAWRNVLKKYLTRLNEDKNAKTIELLKYSALELKEHIEPLLTDGMSWDNYGEWHIDHKIPISKFNKDTPTHIVNSLENLQPLWANDNLSKSNKILEEFKTMYIYINYCS